MVGTDIGFILGKKEKKLSDSFSAIYRNPPQNGHFWHKSGRHSITNDSSNMKIDEWRLLDIPDVCAKLEKSYQTDSEIIC